MKYLVPIIVILVFAIIFTSQFQFNQLFAEDCEPAEIEYSITGGKILRVCEYPEVGPFVFYIDAETDGKLTVKIPEDWIKNTTIDANCFFHYYEHVDPSFYYDGNPLVLVDGSEVKYEGSSFPSSNITIPFSTGSAEIELIASMTPETPAYVANCKDSLNYLKTKAAFQFRDGYWGTPIGENSFQGEKSWAVWLTAMIQQKVINPDSTDKGISKQIVSLPQWFFMNSTGKWWAENKISNQEFVDGVEYLIQKNIIKFET